MADIQDVINITRRVFSIEIVLPIVATFIGLELLDSRKTRRHKGNKKTKG